MNVFWQLVEFYWYTNAKTAISLAEVLIYHQPLECRLFLKGKIILDLWLTKYQDGRSYRVSTNAIRLLTMVTFHKLNLAAPCWLLLAHTKLGIIRLFLSGFGTIWKFILNFPKFETYFWNFAVLVCPFAFPGNTSLQEYKF